MACCLCQSLSIVQGYRIKPPNRGTPSNVEKLTTIPWAQWESWQSWNLKTNATWNIWERKMLSLTPWRGVNQLFGTSDCLRVWRWHKSVCRSCVFYELVLKCLLEHLLEPFQLLLELKLLRSAINPKQIDQPNRYNMMDTGNCILSYWNSWKSVISNRETRVQEGSKTSFWGLKTSFQISKEVATNTPPTTP